ncbi:MAG: 4-hydroxy-tetrahydrodipicolinate synthase [Gammaproteobacteria bacterium]|nr:4-hydroxy-tetrahydrodipicolinate synthase [Gammaproteobacteria bacterium]
MFSGSLVALVTPFKKNLIDEDALRNIVDWQIEQGTHGLVPVGTTGESPTLSEAEHKQVIEIVVEQAAGRVKVLAGAGSNNPTESIEYARCAERAGADGVLVVVGYYNRPSQEGIFEHFKLLHDSTNLPIVVYNIPPRAVVDIRAETMARLAHLERVIGVKDATGDLGRISEERFLFGDSFDYLSGDDLTAIAYRAAGGRGCISVTANVAPALCAKMQNACSAGDYATALTCHEKLVPLHLSLFADPSPAGAKYAASLLNLCEPDVRLPIMPVTESVKLKIRTAMEIAGISIP